MFDSQAINLFAVVSKLQLLELYLKLISIQFFITDWTDIFDDFKSRLKSQKKLLSLYVFFWLILSLFQTLSKEKSSILNFLDWMLIIEVKRCGPGLYSKFAFKTLDIFLS